MCVAFEGRENLYIGDLENTWEPILLEYARKLVA